MTTVHSVHQIVDALSYPSVVDQNASVDVAIHVGENDFREQTLPHVLWSFNPILVFVLLLEISIPHFS